MKAVSNGNLKLAYRTLRATTGRSLLTMLGFIIGVTAVVLVVCVGQGIKQQITRQVGQYGHNLFTVQAGAASNVLGSAGFMAPQDLQTVQHVRGVRTAVPLATTSGSVKGDHSVNAPLIIATSSDFPTVLSQPFDAGGFFEDGDTTQSVVLGSSIAHRLFDDNAPLGQTLTWRGQSFIVSGIFSDFHAPPFSLEANFNNALFLPYATVRSITGTTPGIYEIVGKTTSVHNLDEAVSRVQQALNRSHGGAADTTVAVAGSAVSSSNQIVHLLTLLVAAAAIVALVVGGVGIMNVMLVSVTERMHEIGIRKAIGATNRQILRQFIAEALVLSVAGVIIGDIVAAIIIGLLRLFSAVQPTFVWQVFLLAPLVAIGVGTLFGAAPALKAARKDPIEALRHE